jgi:DnaJ-class molecular chaperone
MARVRVPSTERETLLPCPACEGSGLKPLETEDGQYRVVKCRWCQGNAVVDKTVYLLFRRWIRIYNHNRILGGCHKG